MAATQRYRAFIAAAACLAAWAACDAASAAVSLELKLEKGKTYYERSVVEQRMTQEVMGQQQVMDFVVGIGEKLDVLDVDDKGNMQVRHTYIWSRFKQASPMMDVDYDSAGQMATPAGAEGFAALLGQSYTLRLSPKGEALDIKGVEEMAETVREKAPGADLSSPGNPIATLLDAETLKDMAENTLGIYPDKPVEPGDSWTRTRLTRQGMVMIVNHKWTLQKLENGLATIRSSSSLKADPNGPPMQIEGMAMKLDLSGTQESTIQVQEATGLIASSQGHQELKGQIRIGGSAEGPFDMMAIPMAIESKFTIEMSDRMWEKEPR